MHIEVKIPWILELKQRYRSKEALAKLHAMIAEYDVADFCMVQSFNHESLIEFERQNLDYPKKINTIYLQNWEYEDPMELSYDQLASKEMQGSGSHFQINHVTHELVNKMHENGKIVAVWIDFTVGYPEDEEFYKCVYDLNVDMLTTDHPEAANNFLQAYHEHKVKASIAAD